MSQPGHPGLDVDWLDELPERDLSAAELFDWLDEHALGDGLPVAVPTPAWIASALAAARHAPDLELGRVPPLRLPVTARRLATCAALAGCRPEHYPVLAAAVAALDHPDLNTLGVLTTTGSAALAVIVSGPAGPRLGFNAGGNLLGPGNRPNATVGRALSLTTRILAGAREGLGDMATMGQPGKYTLAFAELEAESPWEPFHVDRGFTREQSAVTVIGVSGTIEVVDAWVESADEILDVLARALVVGTSTTGQVGGTLGGGQPLLLLSPEWATRLAASGLTKTDVKQRLHDAAAVPRTDLPASALRGLAAVAAAGRSVDSVLRVAATADDILLLVAGGIGVKQTLMPNWGGGSRAVTVPLPI